MFRRPGRGRAIHTLSNPDTEVVQWPSARDTADRTLTRMAVTPADLSDLARLDKSQVGPAAEVLARAFRDYTLLRHYFPDEMQRERIAPYFLRLSLYYGIRYGEAYASSPNLEGVAVWIPSHHLPATLWRTVRSVPISVMLGFGREGGGRMKSAGDYIDATHKRLAPFRHWYLQVIGVEPRLQGQGCAGKLLRPMLARTDGEGLPCYLETLDERNVRIYEHFGFEVVEESAIPDTSLTNWAMLREARSLN